MTTYEMSFDSYSSAVEYFNCMEMCRLPVAGIETWTGTTYTDDGARRVMFARGSLEPQQAATWQFSEA